jgi:integrase
MAKTTDPEYVTTGKRGKGYALQIPVIHPPNCVCLTCRNPKKRPPETLDRSFVIRVQRQSSTPKSRNQSIGEARTLKKQLEAELVTAVEEARRARIAAHGPTLRKIADAYAAHLQKEGKRFDRDRYVIEEIVAFFGDDCEPTTISKAEYLRWCAALRERGLAEATLHRRSTTLVALLNRARRWDVIPRHQLDGIEKPKPKIGTPVAYTPRQLAALLGPAIDNYEEVQADAHRMYTASTCRKPPSVVPLRGILLIALHTLLRPSNNLALTWNDITLHATKDEGSFHVTKHKNAAKGIVAEGALHPDLVRYLRSIRPRLAVGLIHGNPVTGKPYVNIRTQWARLIDLANAILSQEEQITGRAEDMYVLRATGASMLAASGADPVLICQMMGDAQLETVRKHYFKSHIAHMQAAVNRVIVPPFASADRA